MTDPKTTTQHAPLEGLLSRIRSRRIREQTRSANRLLDFGCGEHLLNLRALGNIPNRYGIDIRFAEDPPERTPEGIWVGGSFDLLREELAGKKIDCVTALAVIEHLTMDVFLEILGQLTTVTSATARIAATVPTPRAKPVLEFLSFRLALIDRSQIEDHEVYYDRALLERTLESSDWKLERYATFMLGMNSCFVLAKR